jgi:DNA-binding GntR family transcriptional regulator
VGPVSIPSEDEVAPRGKVSSVERAYQHIRRAIISGEYPPNSPLRLQRIATEAGVSIIPVREALRTLEGERLVRTEPNRGAIVAGVSLEDARDAYAMRILLETEAVRRSYEHLTLEVLEQVRELALEHLEQLSDGEAGDEAVHRDLHFAIYRPCGSPWLLRFIQTIWDHTERYRHVGRSPDRVTSEHVAIVEALEQGDPEAAVEALREHLRNTLRAIEESPYIETLPDGGKAST